MLLGMRQFGVVHRVEIHRSDIPGVGPGSLTAYHFPPHSDVLHRLDPADILNGARFVEIQHKSGFQLLTGIVSDLNRSPRRLRRSLDRAFSSGRVRSQGSLESQRLRVDLQMHAGVIQKRGLVNIHVDSVVRLHLKRGLHRICRIWVVVRVRQQLSRQQGRNLRQA